MAQPLFSLQFPRKLIQIFSSSKKIHQRICIKGEEEEEEEEEEEGEEDEGGGGEEEDFFAAA